MIIDFLNQFDWRTLLGSVGSSALLLIIVFKTPIGAWLLTRIQHSFDKQLISFKADVDKKATESERRWQEYRTEKETKFKLLQDIRVNKFGDLMYALHTWHNDVRLILNIDLDREEQRKRIANTESSYEQFRDLYYHSLISLPKDTTITIDKTMAALIDVLKIASRGVNDQREKQEDIFSEALEKFRNQVGPSIDIIEDQLRKMVFPEVDQ